MSKEKSILESTAQKLVIGIILILILAHVEIDLSIHKSKVSFFQTVVDTTKNIQEGYKIVKKLF